MPISGMRRKNDISKIIKRNKNALKTCGYILTFGVDTKQEAASISFAGNIKWRAENLRRIQNILTCTRGKIDMPFVEVVGFCGFDEIGSQILTATNHDMNIIKNEEFKFFHDEEKANIINLHIYDGTHDAPKTFEFRINEKHGINGIKTLTSSILDYMFDGVLVDKIISTMSLKVKVYKIKSNTNLSQVC